MPSPHADPAPEPESRNDLRADQYVWFRSTDRRTARSLLTVLEDHGIAAYYSPAPDVPSSTEPVGQHDGDRHDVDVWVDSAGEQQARSVSHDFERSGGRRELDAYEVDVRFAEIISGFSGPSGVPDPEPQPEPPAQTASQPDLEPTWRVGDGSMLDETPEDEDDHYVPPPAPPLRRPSNKSVLALVVLAIGCVMLFFPGLVGMTGTATAVFGVTLIAGGVGMLLMRLRDGPDDPTDDGARI